MEDWKKLKEIIDGTKGKEFSELKKEEKEALTTMIKNRAAKSGRELLWDVRCVWTD